MRLIISFAALYLSVILLQLSNGGVGPLDALSGLKLNFTTDQIGLLGSAHFIGFFIYFRFEFSLLNSFFVKSSSHYNG